MAVIDKINNKSTGYLIILHGNVYRHNKKKSLTIYSPSPRNVKILVGFRTHLVHAAKNLVLLVFFFLFTWFDSNRLIRKVNLSRAQSYGRENFWVSRKKKSFTQTMVIRAEWKIFKGMAQKFWRIFNGVKNNRGRKSSLFHDDPLSVRICRVKKKKNPFNNFNTTTNNY